MCGKRCFFCESTEALPPHTATCLKMLEVLDHFKYWLPLEQWGNPASPYESLKAVIGWALGNGTKSCSVIYDEDCYEHLKSHAQVWLAKHVATYRDRNSIEFKDLADAIESLPTDQAELTLRPLVTMQKDLVRVGNIWGNALDEMNKLTLSKVYLLLTLINSQSCKDHRNNLPPTEISVSAIRQCTANLYWPHVAWMKCASLLGCAILNRLGLYEQDTSRLLPYSQFRHSDEGSVNIYMPLDMKSKPSYPVDKNEAINFEETYRERSEQQWVAVVRFATLPNISKPLSFEGCKMGTRETVRCLLLTLKPDLLADLYHYFALLNFDTPRKPGTHIRLDLAYGPSVALPDPEVLTRLADRCALSHIAVYRGVEMILREVLGLVREADIIRDALCKLDVKPGVPHGPSADQEDLCRMTVAVRALRRCPLALDLCIQDCPGRNTTLVNSAFVTRGSLGATTFNAMNIVKAGRHRYTRCPDNWLVELLWSYSEESYHELASCDYGHYMMYAMQLLGEAYKVKWSSPTDPSRPEAGKSSQQKE